MKRCKLYLSAFLLLCCITVMAQETVSPTDEEIARKKEINKIKMSEEAVYADVMEIASEDIDVTSSVHQKSREMLQAHVIEVFAKRMKMNKKDVQEIWDVIDDKCQNIEVKKGDIFRVFSYIMKDAIGLGPKKPQEGDVEKYMEANEAPIQQTAPSEQVVNTNDIPQETPAEPIVASVETTENVLQEVATETIDSTAQIAVDIVQEAPVAQPQLPETNIGEPEQPEQPKQLEEPKQLEQPKQPEVKVEMPEKVKTILNKSSMNDIVRYLNTEKQNHTLIYGNMQTMQNPEKCYIIIIEKTTQKVVAMLSQGSDNRINYISGKPDNLNNYKGGKHSAIFVQEY